MRLIKAIMIALATPAPLIAQPAATVVELSNFQFSPTRLQLRSNAPTMLELRNPSGGAHNFSAPEFFAASRIAAASGRLVQAGRVEVPAHSTVQVMLTPSTGTYRLKCSHTLHSTFGMKGLIVVR